MTFHRMSYDPQKSNHQLRTVHINYRLIRIVQRCLPHHHTTSLYSMRSLIWPLYIFQFFTAHISHLRAFYTNWRQFNWIKRETKRLNERDGGTKIEDQKTTNTEYWCTRIILPSCLNYIKFTKFLYEILDWLNFIKCFTVLTETNFDVVFRSETATFFSVADTAARTYIYTNIHTSYLSIHSLTHI